MNVDELHPSDRKVSARPLFNGELGQATSIQLARHGTLEKHVTKTPALLLCISGLTTYEDENELEVTLEPGDYLLIEPNASHWLYAPVESQLVLLK